MPELLLELLSEEIPARMQARAAADLKDAVLAALADAGVPCRDARAFATPRRLALVVDEVAEGQPDRTVERRGPRVDGPAAARDGFLRSLGDADYRLTEQEDRKGRVLIATWQERGRPTREIVAQAMPGVLARFAWPKSMRWGEGEVRWVRPLRSILCLLDGEAVTFSFAGIRSCGTTLGHSFMSKEAIEAAGFADYETKLAAAKVVLDPVIRRRMIFEGAERLAAGQGLRVRDDPGLLDELTGLVEWPVPLLGRIDPDSMALPPEVLTTSMRTHQRYLALEDGKGRLAPLFVVVANIEAPDGGKAIVAGNERVLRARLWDARFFWEQDRKVRLEDRLLALDATVFHEKLGSVGDKVRRLVALAADVLAQVTGASSSDCKRAAFLCKSDLKTGMVGEFPELQGVMGCYYARNQGENDAVATAIAEQYAPRGPSDRCPTAPTSIALALSDKLDTLAAFFSIGIKPTGSGDPFALRRAALGIIRMIVENEINLDLWNVLTFHIPRYHPSMGDQENYRLADDVVGFIVERLVVYQRDQGFRHDLLRAVLGATAVHGEGDELLAGHDRHDLLEIVRKGTALDSFLSSEAGRDLLTAYRRASNIIGIELKRTAEPLDVAPDSNLLTLNEEIVLDAALKRQQADIASALRQKDYQGAMQAVAALRGPVDRFFDKVTVNAPEPDLRLNRLRLLGSIRSALASVADLGLIEDRVAA